MMKCCMVKIGELRHLVDIEQEVEVNDDMGGQTVSWVLKVQMYAKIKMSSGQEVWKHDVIRSRSTHTFTMHYNGSIVASDRISFDGRLFNIDSIENLEEKNKYLIIKATEGKPQ